MSLRVETYLTYERAWSNSDYQLGLQSLQWHLMIRILKQVPEKLCSRKDKYIIMYLNDDPFAYLSL